MMSNDALLLMDYQMGICGPDAASGPEAQRRGILANAKGALDAARATGKLVIFVRVAFDDHYTLRTNRMPRFDAMEKAGGMKLGSPAAEICAEVRPLPGEIIITKGCVNPFIGTALAEVLTGHRVGELYLGGVATNFVVEATARHAADSGYAVNVMEDCCCSFTAEMHEWPLKNTFPMFAKLCTSADYVSRAGAAA